jgi:hypothetical protein
MQTYVSIRSGSRHARLKLLGYYVQRAVTSRRLRRVATHVAIAGLRTLHGPAQTARTADATSVAALREHGWLRLGPLLSAQQCAEALAWLKERDMIAVRGGGQAFRLDAVPPGTRIADYPLATVVHCPHMLAVANHPAMLRLAAAYLGYTPTVTLMGLRWSFPAAAADADVQGFHRDSEPASIKLMVYLTDVDAASGPHSYVPGTHRDRMPLRLRRYAERDIERAGGSVVVTGSAGAAFVIDSKGIHKGTPPTARARLLLVVQYSLLPCLMYEYAPVPYRGAGAFDRYVNRLMVAAA